MKLWQRVKRSASGQPQRVAIEPVGLGAVIRDATGGVAVRLRDGSHKVWAGDGVVNRWMSWGEFVHPVELISAGYVRDEP